jgi:acetyltransferase-like isoleucine patch superfamily enzyme
MLDIKSWIAKKMAKKSGPCNFKRDCSISRDCYFEGNNVVYPYAKISSSRIGRGTYIGPHSDICLTQIGRFCSIGPNVITAVGRHPVHTFVSTHPAFFSKIGQAGFTFVNDSKFEELVILDSLGHSIIIGNDVWIGANVTILGGVRIGDGAIVGAGSVVNRDVDNYSIVAGNPIKVIRRRFDDSVCNRLIEIKWWNRSDAWLSENAHKFSNAVNFLDWWEIMNTEN